ncbi:MAG: DUF4386 domain-containing protein [Terracidiphilus sp.]|jgi:hypothetical protein
MADRIAGLNLRQAAVIAGLGYLLNPVSYAEFALYPKLVIAGNIDQTVQNITNHGGLFVAAVLCYLVNFIGDVVIAWALYVLLAPVNQAVALLTAWFRLIYTAVALGGVMNLVTVYRLLHTPEYLTLFGANELKAQVDLLLNAYGYTWAMSLLIFGIHLVLLGCLIFRSNYVPRILGILLAIDGVGWMVSSLRPYLFPNAPLGYISITYFGELVFMLWLLIRGWKLKEPAQS